MAWQALATDAVGRAADDRGAARILAEVCLAADEIGPEWSIAPRPGGLPSGRPTAALTRHAARSLLGAVCDETDRESLYLQVVGLIFESWKPQLQPTRDDPESELRAGLDQCVQAAELARRLADDALLAWCLYHRARNERSMMLWEQGRTSFRQSADMALRLLDTDSAGHPGAFTLFASAWADQPADQLRVIACRALKWLVSAAAIRGDIVSWEAAVRELLPLAEPLAPTRPTVVVEALGCAGRLARHVGDRDGFREVEERLRRWAAESGVNRVKRGWLVRAAANAEFLQDYERAHLLHREAVDVAVEGIDGMPTPGSPPRYYLPAVAILEGLGLRSRRIDLGNSAYDAALTLWRTRRTAEDQASWDEASQWLDLAEHAWHSDGHNGLVAVQLTRARLQTDAPGGADLALAAEIALKASRDALQAGTRAAAALFAAEFCTPGDLRMRQRLDEIIAEATPAQRAARRAVRATWHRRYAELLEATDQPQAAASDAWRSAERDALAAAHGLEVDGVFVDAGGAADAWLVAAAACGKSDAISAQDTVQVRLSRLLNVIRCVADLLITTSHPERQTRLTTRYGIAFEQAADLAERLGDTRAADMIMEAVRRDRVGVLITDLIRRPDVTEMVRAAAERVCAANSATPSVPVTKDPEPDHTGQKERRALTRIAEGIAIQRSRSTAQADEILGVISALADGRTVPHITAASLLAKRETAQPAAVLQFCPTGVGMLRSGAGPRLLYRRLSWSNGKGNFEEYLDHVPLTFAPEQLNPDSMAYWRRLHTWSALLLPDPLRELLAGHEAEHPLRLLIIPTGMFDIAFDALPVDNNRHLIDAASVTIQTSLTTASHLLQRSSSLKEATSIAVYDTQTLSHTDSELKALHDNLPPVHEVSGVPEFRTHLSAPRGHGYRGLAMAVHGLDDQDGWGQVKQFPDRTTLSAAEALGLDYPQLCVLASCYSRIRTRWQVELAGFPLSFFARGATTVIGSLLAVNDQATSEIMHRFWANLAEDNNPVHALYTAKLGWLAEEPRRRIEGARHWAGLIAFGGAHL
jgi:hypothetical protein